MSLLYTPSVFVPKTLTPHHHRDNHRNPHPFLSLSSPSPSPSRIFFSLRTSQLDDDEEPEPESKSVPDEWGEKAEPDIEPVTRFSSSDPTVCEDEWGTETAVVEEGSGEDKNLELKRFLLDSVYGSDFGFRATTETRAEVAEFVNQLEAANPVPNPTEVPALLEGNWVLVYTAFSELLPLIAVGSTPFLKVERISQNIDTTSGIVENSTTLSSPLATFSFSATASFEVRSPSRIQVQFKEASFKPPEIKSQFDLPENVDIFGQKISITPVQQFLNPVQDLAASISGMLYGLPPLKVPIPGERSSSWLITTYLDEDLRISRGDGGLFVLVREGSPLLDL